MLDIHNTQMREDPYYWRNKVLFWRSLNEVDNSQATWVEEVSKEKLKDHNQNQSALTKLWYNEGMQIDIDSKTAMADSLKFVISHIKDILAQAKENGDHDILGEIIEDTTAELLDEQEERRIKALAVSAIAEADGHAPDAKKILDQIGSEQYKKFRTEFKQLIRPPSAQNNGR